MRGVTRRSFGTWLACLLGVLLTSCYYAVPKDKIAAIKRVGVISFLGDSIELSEERLLPIPGTMASAPFQVNSWEMDRYLRVLIADQIARQGVMKVIPFEYDPAALWKANYGGPDFTGEKMTAAVRNRLSELARNNDLDALAIAYKPPRRSDIEPYQLLPFCLYRSYGFTGKAVSYHVLVTIRVLDGRTMETLGVAAFYHKENLDASFWPPSIDARQLTSLERKTKDILRQKVVQKLEELGFGKAD